MQISSVINDSQISIFILCLVIKYFCHENHLSREFFTKNLFPKEINGKYLCRTNSLVKWFSLANKDVILLLRIKIKLGIITILKTSITFKMILLSL